MKFRVSGTHSSLLFTSHCSWCFFFAADNCFRGSCHSEAWVNIQLFHVGPYISHTILCDVRSRIWELKLDLSVFMLVYIGLIRIKISISFQYRFPALILALKPHVIYKKSWIYPLCIWSKCHMLGFVKGCLIAGRRGSISHSFCWHFILPGGNFHVSEPLSRSPFLMSD